MGSLPQRSDRLEQSLWPRWARIAGRIGLFGVIIAVSIIGRGRKIEWGILFGVSVAIAGAIFWRKYRRPWYWPALGILAAAHVALAVYTRWPIDPGSAGVIFIYALVLDVGLDSLWLFWMGWLFDPRDKPRTSSQRATEVVIYIFVIIAIGLIAFLIWAVGDANKEAARLSRVVMERSSSRSLHALEACLDADGRHPHRDWQDVPAPRPTVHRYDDISDRGTIITDTGQERIVRITTLRAGPLRDREISSFAQCLDPDPTSP